MKLNFFTPIPPARSDIANCVERILPVLAKAADVTLWTDDHSYDRAIEALAPVRVYSPDSVDWRELNRADYTIYNVGNDGRFHGSIMQVCAKHPGVVILHDLSVHELALYTFGKTGDWQSYISQLDLYGPQAVADWRLLREQKLKMDEMSSRYPLTHWPLRGAHGVIVHNGRMFHETCQRLDAPCLSVPLPYVPAPAMFPGSVRSLPKEPLQLVICGYLNGANRRLKEVLQALARFPRKDALVLHIAGRVADAKALKKQVSALGLDRVVKLYGYVSEEKLAELLNDSHLALNLRYPSMGEASGAQLRFWNHSLPTLVTRTGWYAQLPQDSVLFVDPEHEERDLHRHLDAALDDYEAYAKVGLVGRQVLEERHSAEVFVDALLQFLPEVGRYRKTAFAPKLAERVGRVGSGFAYGEPARQLYARVAGEIALIAGQRSASVTSDATA